MKGGARILIACLAVLGTLSGRAGAQLANSTWPMLQHDAQHTGRTSVQGPLSANLNWTSPLFASPRSGPAIGPDGTIYQGSGRMLCAIDPDNGFQHWCKRIGGTVKHASPAVDSDGNIYIGGRDNRMHSFSPSGTLNWEFAVGVDGDVATGPAIATDGTIVFGGSGYVFAVNPNSTMQWSLQVKGPILTASPALSPDESIIYVATVHGFIYAITSSGTLLRERKLDTTIRYSAPSVAADGTVYIGTARGLIALEPDLDTLWEFPTEGRVTNTAAIAANGTIYAGSLGAVGLGTLHAISPLGAELWRYDGGRLRGSALIGSDGTIYIVPGASVVALHPNGTPFWQFPTERGVYASPALDANGNLYVASGERTLYALEP